MPRGKCLGLEEAHEQKRLQKKFCDKHQSEADQQALAVELLAKCDIWAIAETDIAPRLTAPGIRMN